MKFLKNYVTLVQTKRKFCVKAPWKELTENIPSNVDRLFTYEKAENIMQC